MNKITQRNTIINNIKKIIITKDKIINIRIIIRREINMKIEENKKKTIKKMKKVKIRKLALIIKTIQIQDKKNPK